MTSAIKAMAEIIASKWTDPYASRCNVARCGMAMLGHQETTTVYAGLIPQILTAPITLALTEEMGGPADPRQAYGTAFDNPSFTLHIVGEDMLKLDTVAHEIIAGTDRTGHYNTTYGEVNGISVGPPKREVRKDRPRYDVQLLIEMEIARP